MRSAGATRPRSLNAAGSAWCHRRCCRCRGRPARARPQPVVEPGTLGAKPGAPDLTVRMASHAAWWQGFDPETTRRVGLALSRVVGILALAEGTAAAAGLADGTRRVGRGSSRRAAASEPLVSTLPCSLQCAAGPPCSIPTRSRTRHLVATWRTDLVGARVLLG